MLQGLTLLPLLVALVAQLWRTTGPVSLALLLERAEDIPRIDQV